MTPKELAHKFFDRVWNEKDTSVIDELLAPDVVGTSEGDEVRGPAGFRASVYEPITTAFPDVRLTIHDIVADEHQAAVRWTVHGTHTGPLMHLPASGRKVKFTGITWLKFQDGKIISGADSYNLHGLIAYLSAGQECASVRSA